MRTRVSRSHRSHPAFPTQWFYGFLRALPGDRAFLPPSSALLSANLTPASGSQAHPTSPSASAPFVIGASASTAACPTIRDDRVSPLPRNRMGLLSGDLGQDASKKF